MYAIVDIETTGGSAKNSRITEIAVVVRDDEKELDRFETLVNPERPIPPFITNLTNIDDEMVAEAPKFSEIANKLLEILSDNVFVAHNVHFDYSFIREEFARVGIKYSGKRLCTVRLARKLLPNLYSYSLGKIAQQLGHEIEGRHRAMGDCSFTADLFAILQQKDEGGYIQHALNQRSREASMPPNLDKTRFDRIPATCGVYIFKGAKKQVLYVGKAKNLKARVAEHFRGTTHTRDKNRFVRHIQDVDFVECPNELISLLCEAELIKKYWPPHNRVMKRVSLNWGIFSYEDQNGYGRFSLGRVGKWAKPLVSFRTQYEGRLMLEKVCDAYSLCARFCDLQTAEGPCATEIHGDCYQACVGAESAKSYGERYAEAVAYLGHDARTMVIRSKGFEKDEWSIVLLEKGRYKGYGTMKKDEAISLDSVKENIRTGYDDQDMQSIIRTHVFAKPGKHEVVIL